MIEIVLNNLKVVKNVIFLLLKYVIDRKMFILLVYI